MDWAAGMFVSEPNNDPIWLDVWFHRRIFCLVDNYGTTTVKVLLDKRSILFGRGEQNLTCASFWVMVIG